MKRIIVGFILVLLILSGCSAASQPDEVSRLVTVSILPQKYFVEQIAGDLVNVNVMVQPGESPENYEPSPDQMRSVSRSQIYFSLGVPFEAPWLEKIKSANPDIQVIDTSVSIERLPMTAHEHEGDDHADEEENLMDPHIWTSPDLVKLQAEEIARGLIEMDPINEAAYQENLQTFLAEIDALDAEIRERLSSLESRKFMVYHPTWGYFAHEYNLEQIAIEIEGTEPSAQELAATIEEAKEENVKVIFVQPQFSTRSAETISQEIGGTVEPLDSLAENWMENMRHVSRVLAENLSE